MSKLLDDYLDLEPLARELNRHPRTVRRWLNQPGGLPYTRIGNRILIHIPTAKAWIFGRMRSPNPRRNTEAQIRGEHPSQTSTPPTTTPRRRKRGAAA
jgi:hypothetical protein